MNYKTIMKKLRISTSAVSSIEKCNIRSHMPDSSRQKTFLWNTDLRKHAIHFSKKFYGLVKTHHILQKQKLQLFSMQSKSQIKL